MTRKPGKIYTALAARATGWVSFPRHGRRAQQVLASESEEARELEPSTFLCQDESPSLGQRD